MNLKPLLKQLHPMQAYSIKWLSQCFQFKSQRAVDLARAELVALVNREHFPARGDTIRNGHIAWFGFRFLALCHKVTFPLPVVDRPITVFELYPHMQPQQRKKLAHFLPVVVVPEDLHPFLIGVDAWSEYTPTKKRPKKRPKKGKPIPPDYSRIPKGWMHKDYLLRAKP